VSTADLLFRSAGRPSSRRRAADLRVQVCAATSEQPLALPQPGVIQRQQGRANRLPPPRPTQREHSKGAECAGWLSEPGPEWRRVPRGSQHEPVKPPPPKGSTQIAEIPIEQSGEPDRPEFRGLDLAERQSNAQTSKCNRTQELGGTNCDFVHSHVEALARTPSPVPPRLMKTAASVHPLPQGGEGCVARSWTGPRFRCLWSRGVRLGSGVQKCSQSLLFLLPGACAGPRPDRGARRCRRDRARWAVDCRAL